MHTVEVNLSVTIFNAFLIIACIAIVLVVIVGYISLWREIRRDGSQSKANHNILNRISMIVVSILVICWLSLLIYKQIAEDTKNPYNFVDLQMRFKRYILTNKYQETDKDYVFYLVNPVTGDEYKAYVADYLYMNVYFVGDTIR